MACSIITTIMFIHLCCLTLLSSHLVICRGSSEIPCIPSEREALVEFKQYLEDPSNRLSSWNADVNTNCCEWAGVVCSNITSHILQLHLNISPYDAYGGTMFGGKINPSLLDLKYLNYWDLSGNDFGGMQIPDFLCAMTTLTYLNLSHAGFSGKIPHQIGHLSNLLYLDLGYAANGTIPYQIGNLTNLLYLDLGGASNFESPLFAKNVDWLSGLSSLKYLALSNANLSKSSDWLQTMQALPSLVELHLSTCVLPHYYYQPSTTNFSSLLTLQLSHIFSPSPTISSVPSWIFGLRKLISLQMSYNDIQGPIPNGIRNLSLLENLDLSINSFSSSIPDWLYGLHHLKFLNLEWNNLHGTISDVLGNLTSLVDLDLSDNKLEGMIPTTLGNLTSLVHLDLSYNELERMIPTTLGNLTSLVHLDLSDNKLEGMIPTTLGNLTSLVHLDLSDNKLEGMIPTTLGNLTSLVHLDLSDNKLEGMIPTTFGNLTSLADLDLSDNKLEGMIPTTLGNLTSLADLDLSDNQFIGNPFEVLRSLSKLSYLSMGNNLFQGVVKEDDLADLTRLNRFYASGNNVTLKVGPNWSPSFQVIELYMSSWNLGPSFPSWIQSQKDLQYLRMSNTGISDSIPTWFWGTYSNNFSLDLSHNHIKGELQSTLQNPIFYKTIDLSSNQLSGQLPHLSAEVVQLDLSSNLFSGSMFDFLCKKNDEPKILEFLNLSSNNLSGEIPDCWQMWPSMVYVNLESNYFVGNLPPSLGSLAWLQYLHIRNNTLSGIFLSILKNSKLVTLDLGENKLTGIIPAWVGERLLNLERLRLRSNNFSGRIPSQICALSVLRVLDLAQNNLFGSIPNCFNHLNAMMLKNKSNDSSPAVVLESGNLTWIGYDSMLLWLKGRGDEYGSILGIVTNIDLSNNNLSGKIPREITDLDGLIFLNLSKNQLTDQIPPGIGNMQSLESIDFSRNQLSGEIPPTISNISFLHQLDLSSNHLKGEIPTGTQIQSLEASNFVGNNLCGPPLPINCNSHFKIPNNADQNDEESDGHGVNWFFVSVALGFIVGFWGVVAPLFISRSWRYTYYRFIDDMWYKIQSCW